VRAALALGLLVLASGCLLGNGDESSITAGELKQLVLQPGDVGKAFQQFDEGRQVMADQPGGSRADPARFGRQDGWKARYRRQGTSRTAGPLVIESRADVFESTDGAKDEFDAAKRDTGAGGLGWQEVDAPELGDDTFAMTLLQGARGSGVRYYLVSWRTDNATASVLVNGFDRGMELGDAVDLARKQARRIETAASS
jgi:hypothetical protein